MSLKYRNPNKRKIGDKRKSDIVSIGEALQDAFQAPHLKQAFQEAMLVHSWEKIMGKVIAAHTTKIFIHKKKLFVELDSAPLKRELNSAKPKIMQMILELTKNPVVTDIVLL